MRGVIRIGSYWFNERPWFFWDIDANGAPRTVNEPRKAYFDHRALGVRFQGEDENAKPLQLPPFDEKNVPLLAERRSVPEVVVERAVSLAAAPIGRIAVLVGAQAMAPLAAPLNALRAPREGAANNAARPGRVFLRLQGLDLGLVPATGFDVHLVTDPRAELKRGDKSFVGSVALFRHQPPRPPGGAGETAGHAGHEAASGGHAGGDMFDATAALSALGDADLPKAQLVLVPYPLLTVPGKVTVHVAPLDAQLKVRGVQFLVAR